LSNPIAALVQESNPMCRTIITNIRRINNYNTAEVGCVIKIMEPKAPLRVLKESSGVSAGYPLLRACQALIGVQ
jgi:hypothetical protein